MSRPIVDLANKRALVIGIANEHSIAAGCARAFADAGARLAVTYLNDKALPHVEPVAAGVGAEWLAPLDVCSETEMAALFTAVDARWGGLDILLHAVAFAPAVDLNGRLVDSSAAGFAEAMDVSCHSFVRLARLAEPRMTGGGCLLTLSFLGSQRAFAAYAMMGPIKAALESATRYLAVELGPKGIRAHAISPGPIATRAAGGIDGFAVMLARAAAAPLAGPLDIDDIGPLAAFLASDGARRITGTIIPVDCGEHLLP